jgi:hypothetical protein
MQPDLKRKGVNALKASYVDTVDIWVGSRPMKCIDATDSTEIVFGYARHGLVQGQVVFSTKESEVLGGHGRHYGPLAFTKAAIAAKRRR